MMTVPAMRMFFPKQAPVTIKYRCYKAFNQHNFNLELECCLLYLNENAEYDDIGTNFVEILNKHAPIKTKLIRENNSPFMTKSPTKAIMNRSRLKNKFIKDPNIINKNNFRKQRNYVVNLLRKEKKRYYNNLNLNKITDNRKFWQTIKPFFSDKGTFRKTISLIENDNIISVDEKVANIFNDYFSNAVKNIQIKKFNTEPVPLDILNIIDSILIKYNNHPSILKIKDNVNNEDKFNFSNTIKQPTVRRACPFRLVSR